MTEAMARANELIRRTKETLSPGRMVAETEVSWLLGEARFLAETVLSLPPTGVDRDTGLIGVEEAARDLLAARESDNRTVGYRADLWSCLEAALAPKVIDRDIEGETIGTSISGAMLTAMQAYNPRLYGEEKWETTLANIEPFIRKAARSISRPIEAALRPFAAAADLWDEMGDTRPIDEDGKLTVADLRRARDAIRALASPSLHGDGK